MVVSLTAAAALAAQDQSFDIIFRHGRIVDGSGNPWYRADLAIRGKQIVAIGDLSRA